MALRASTLGALLSAGCALLCLICARQAVGLLDGAGGSVTTPVLGLEVLTTGTAALVAGWLALLLLAGSVEALPAARLPRMRTITARFAPHLGPRIAAGLVGSILAVGFGGTAQAHAPLVATPAATQSAVPSSTPAGGAPAGGTAAQPEPSERRPTPEPGWRPTDSPAPRPSDGTAIELVSRGTATPDTVVVRSGDTLWDITARHLGPEADAARIAQEWPRWHETNREAIGPDPDLLLPGTTLVPPTAQSAPSEVAS